MSKFQDNFSSFNMSCAQKYLSSRFNRTQLGKFGKISKIKLVKLFVRSSRNFSEKYHLWRHAKTAILRKKNSVIFRQNVCFLIRLFKTIPVRQNFGFKISVFYVFLTSFLVVSPDFIKRISNLSIWKFYKIHNICLSKTKSYQFSRKIDIFWNF